MRRFSFLTTTTPLQFVAARFASSSSSSSKSDDSTMDDDSFADKIVQSQQQHREEVARRQSSSIVDHSKNEQQQKQTSSGEMLNADDAFLLRSMQNSINQGKLSPQAAQYAETLYRRLGAHASPVISKARELMGDQRGQELTAYQRSLYGAALSNEMGNAVSGATEKMFAEQKGMQDFAQEGKPTGENYWFEAGGTLTSTDLPREMKDDLFEEMKKDRPSNSEAAKDPKF